MNVFGDTLSDKQNKSILDRDKKLKNELKQLDKSVDENHKKSCYDMKYFHVFLEFLNKLKLISPPIKKNQFKYTK